MVVKNNLKLHMLYSTSCWKSGIWFSTICPLLLSDCVVPLWKPFGTSFSLITFFRNNILQVDIFCKNQSVFCVWCFFCVRTITLCAFFNWILWCNGLVLRCKIPPDFQWFSLMIWDPPIWQMYDKPGLPPLPSSAPSWRLPSAAATTTYKMSRFSLTCNI